MRGTAGALRLLVLGAALALPAGGCIGLFQPDEPEPPLVQNCDTSLQGDYASPTRVLHSLSQAMTKKVRGRCVYLAAFADSVTQGVAFHTTFPPEIVEERQVLGGVPVWNRDVEGVFYDDFMDLSTATYALAWLAWPEAGDDVGTATDSTLYRRYLVTPLNGVDVLAAGTVALRFHLLTNGNWVVTSWVDGPDESRLAPGVDEQTLLDWTLSQRRLEAYDANF